MSLFKQKNGQHSLQSLIKAARDHGELGAGDGAMLLNVLRLGEKTVYEIMVPRTDIVCADIEDGIDGLIHVSDISWTKKVRHPGEMYKAGDTVQAKVLTVDKANEKFTLGVKQLSEDPWNKVPDKYPVGTVVTGTITNITDFGLFVEVEEGIEGLVHVSEISSKKVKSPAELFKEGVQIQAKVIHVSADERRLGLSIKQLKEDEEKRKPKEFRTSGPSDTGIKLGDLLMQKQEDAGNEDA